MRREELNDRLSRITTCWTVLRQAHQGSADAAAATAAQQLLMKRYGGAIYRYLLKALGDPNAADDLTQEFALSLVRGEFRRADPQRGRFRDYVKKTRFHLVSKYRKRQYAGPRPLPAEGLETAAVASPAADPDAEFLENWRDELLARTWQALAEAQPTFFTVLHFRAARVSRVGAILVDEGLLLLSC